MHRAFIAFKGVGFIHFNAVKDVFVEQKNKMENIFPDIESFKPWELEDVELDNLISNMQDELKSLHETERSYKISIVLALDSLIRQQKMRLYWKPIENRWMNSSIIN
jgi:hypothetical protein